MNKNSNPQWNKYEAALLLDALLNVMEKRITKQEVVAKISYQFRQRAKKDGIEISSTYRNENGINLQLGAMEYAFTNGLRGVKHVSKLFYDTVDMYRYAPQQFKLLLQCAQKMYFHIT